MDTDMDSGDDVSHTEPFHRGCAPPHTVLRLDLVDRDLTENLKKFPTEREFLFDTTAERECVRDVEENLCYVGADHDAAGIDQKKTYVFPDENIITVVPNVSVAAERMIARDVKEKPCYICLDFDTQHKSTAEFDKKQTHELPDGNIISVGAGRFRCVEVLFQPCSGIHDTSFQNVTKCDVDICKDLYDNVVHPGATTIFQRMVERMAYDLTALATSTMRSRWLLVRIRGSIVSTSS